MYRQEGLGGFFVGVGPTAMRQGLAMGIRFALYDEVKKVLYRAGAGSDG